MDSIELLGVTTHNLKNLSVSFPLEKLTVVTGVSGSGKSSLVFDTLYAESYRRYVDSLSSFARQYLKALPKPKVREVKHLLPAIAVRQTRHRSNHRSTVGTVTELSTLLQIFFTHLGVPVCPQCQTEVRQDTPKSIAMSVATALSKEAQPSNVSVLAPLKVWKASNLRGADLKIHLLQQGFSKVRHKNELYLLETFSSEDLLETEVLIDRWHGDADEMGRFQEALSLALAIGKGRVIVSHLGDDFKFSSSLQCNTCDRHFTSPVMPLFSFNHPLGACDTCQGYGRVREGDWNYHTRFQRPTYVICLTCEGHRFSRDSLVFFIGDKNIKNLFSMSVLDLKKWFDHFTDSQGRFEGLADTLEEAKNRLDYLIRVGIGYLTLDRVTSTLSGGELQRISMASCLGSQLTETLYCLDEPTAGLHPRDSARLLEIMREFCHKGNTVVVVEHDRLIMNGADHRVIVGPGAGHLGGKIVESHEDFAVEYPLLPANSFQDFLHLKHANTHNLQEIDVRFPVGALTTVCGVSGSGKTSLIQHTLSPLLTQYFSGEDVRSQLGPRAVLKALKDVIVVDQRSLGRSSRSSIATYLGAFDGIRKLFAAQELAKKHKLTPGSFSFNVAGGRCENCQGLGTVTEDLSFLGELDVLCGVCEGRRFRNEVLEVQVRGKNLIEVLSLTLLEAVEFFEGEKSIVQPLLLAVDLGLGYMTLGQTTSSFSGGEAQRLKLLGALNETSSNPNEPRSVFILDEPTTGLSDRDVYVLWKHLKALTEAGHTVIVVEHHLDMIAHADWVIELGPEASHEGGLLLYEGPPKGLFALDTWTSRALHAP